MPKKSYPSQAGPILSGNNNNNSDVQSSRRGSRLAILEDNGTTPQPPPYSSSPTSIAPVSRSMMTISPTLPRINYSKYTIPEATLSKDGTTISTYYPGFTSSPQTLTKFIHEQCALPPLAYVHIVGKSADFGSEPDFDLKINLLPYLIPSHVQEGTAAYSGDSSLWNYMKLVGDNELALRGNSVPSLKPRSKGGLHEWTARFCKEPSSLKS
jgi:hypothetical protein